MKVQSQLHFHIRHVSGKLKVNKCYTSSNNNHFTEHKSHANLGLEANRCRSAKRFVKIPVANGIFLNFNVFFKGKLKNSQINVWKPALCDRDYSR